MTDELVKKNAVDACKGGGIWIDVHAAPVTPQKCGGCDDLRFKDSQRLANMRFDSQNIDPNSWEKFRAIWEEVNELCTEGN